MFLPGSLKKTEELMIFFTKNSIKFSIRRIRPLTDKNGKTNPPGHSGFAFDGHQKVDNNNYYSNEEIEFLEKTKSNSIPNCLLTFEDGSTQAVNVNEITAKKLNFFKGWFCYAGSESLMIDWDENVYRATCRQGGAIGKISDVDFFEKLQKLSNGIVCNKTSCNCAADINITKFKKN